MGRTGWFLTLVVALAGGLLVARSMRDGDAGGRRTPPPAGVFTAGAMKEAPAAAVEVFAERLPALSIALDRLSERVARGDEGAIDARQAVERAAAAIPGEAGAAALGPDVSARLVEVVRRARAVVEDGAEDGPLLAAVGALDDALAAAGLALYLDVDITREWRRPRRRVFLYAFRVEAARPWRVAGGGAAGEVRALRLRRLDQLNFEHGALGIARPNLREALVLMDQSEDELTELILPALRPDAPLRLSRDGSDDYEGRAELEAAAGERVRRELAEALGPRAADAVQVGEALVARERALDAVEERLEARGLVMARPTRLFLPEGYLEDLERTGLVPPGTLRELRRLDGVLTRDASWQAFGALAARLGDAIERHEVQHRLDYAAGGRAMPAALAELVGPAEPMPGQPNPFAQAARDELSAYLAQLAWDERLTGVNLVLLGRLLLARAFWGTAESNAAVVMFEGLAQNLGISYGELVIGGRVQRIEVAALLRELLARPPADVRKAAARLWKELFGAALPDAQPVS